MKNIIAILFLLLIISSNILSQENTAMEKINSIIAEVKEKFAPDKRVAIFSLEVIETDNKIIIKGETNLTEAKLEFVKMMNEAELKFVDEIELLPSEKLSDKKFGVINLSVANFRSKPDHIAELVTQGLLGTPVKVYKKGEDGFYLIQTPDNYISWLDDDGVEFMNEAEMNEWLSSPKIIYTKEYGFSYSDAE